MTQHVLSARGEQEWVRLRRHLDRSRAFWLGFVLTEDAAAAATLFERTVANRRIRAEGVVPLRAADPAELAGLLDAIEARGAEPRGCTWVSAPLLPDPEWRAAWRRLLRSLNHRRDVLRDRLGGLVIVAPGAVKVDAQREAPDLWSVRDLLVELPIERPTGVRRASVPDHSMLPRPAGAAGLSFGDIASDELAAEVTAVLALPDEELAGSARVRAAAATAAALEAGDEQTAAVLLLRRAEVAADAGDLAGALDLVRVGFELTDVEEETAIRIADAASWMARTVEDLPQAHRYALEALRRADARWEREPSAERARQLASSLAAVGEVEVDQRELDVARSRIARSLDLREQIVATEGSTANRAALAATLRWRGFVELELGDPATARSFLERAVGEARIAADEDGSTEALTELADALMVVGQIDVEEGDTPSARSRFDEALLLRQRLIDERDAPPWVLADLLALLGQMELDLGEPGLARVRFDRALRLQEQRAESTGTAALHSLADALQDLGDADRDLGNLPAAHRGYTRALDRRERLAAQLGTDHARRRLAVILNRLAGVELGFGEDAAAVERIGRSVAIYDDLAQRARTPDALDGLIVGLQWLADIAKARGDPAAARVHLLRAAELADELGARLGTARSLRRLADIRVRIAGLDAQLLFGGSVRDHRTDPAVEPATRSRSPQATADLSAQLNRLATVELSRGDTPDARALLTRALALDEERAAQVGTATEWRAVRYTLRRLLELDDDAEDTAHRTRLAEVEAVLERLGEPVDESNR